MNNRDKAIIASIHMRSAIRGLKDTGFYNLSTVIHIDKRCYAGELKFQKAKPYRYHELQEITKLGSKSYDRMFKKVEIATDTFIEVLYRANIHEFKNYFKLKEKSFDKLFNMFGEDDECEGQTIDAADHIVSYADKAEELYYWQLWIKRNQQGFNYETSIQT